MSPEDALSLLSARLEQHGLADRGWTGALDNAVRRFGQCSYGPRQITLSRHLVTINSDAETLDTILHEIAHALAWTELGQDCGHDARWQEIAERVGARPERNADMTKAQVVPGAYYLIHRETAEVFRSYHTRPRRGVSSTGYIRGRRAETEGKLKVVSAREMARLRDQDAGSPAENPDFIRSFDKHTSEALSAEIDAAIAAVCADHDLSFQTAGFRINAGHFEGSFRVTIAEEHVEAGDRAEFGVHAHVFGLKADDFKRQFKVGDRLFELVKIKPRNRKYPIIGRECGSDVDYKFPATVLDQLKERAFGPKGDG